MVLWLLSLVIWKNKKKRKTVLPKAQYLKKICTYSGLVVSAAAYFNEFKKNRNIMKTRTLQKHLHKILY